MTLTMTTLRSKRWLPKQFYKHCFPCIQRSFCRWINTDESTNGKSNNDSTEIASATIQVTPTMKADSYQEHSIHQYEAHLGCQDYLEGALERLSRRIQLEDQFLLLEDERNRRRRHLVDLGSADGSNSIQTLRMAVQTLHKSINDGSGTNDKVPLLTTFNEHPASNQRVLETTLSRNREWFQNSNVRYDILMKSFYEPLFDKESVDLLLCYICLHWLDTNDTENPVSEWKQWWPLNNNQQATLSDFVFMNEATVPGELVQKWREALAKKHLAKFLALRSRELRPGAEAILMMVGQPNQYVCPSRNSVSALTLAMQNCVDKGTLRKTILEKTLIPYYVRTVEDLKEAFVMAAEMEVPLQGNAAGDDETTSTQDERFPGALLKLVDAKTYTVNVGQGSIDGTFEMFWSIHRGSVLGAGATKTELESVRKETKTMFRMLYDPQDGVNVTYLACLIRRRTRRAWS